LYYCVGQRLFGNAYQKTGIFPSILMCKWAHKAIRQTHFGPERNNWNANDSKFPFFLNEI
jgi:hypothetical protein